MKQFLATVAVLAILAAAPARAEEPGMMDNVKVGFSQAIKDIQTWFGSDTPETISPAAGEEGVTVTEADDALQAPTPVDPSIIEPAAGANDDDMLQVPPQYIGPDNSGMTPRASAFDNNQSITAFGDAGQMPVIDDYNAIAPAAGEGDTATPDCAAIAAAAANGEEVDAALVESCKNGTAANAETTTTPAAEVKAPAQPALEPAAEVVQPAELAPAAEPAATPEPLPETEPATGQ